MALYELAIDPKHSAAEFAATFAMNSIVKGRFLDISGTITLDTDDPARSSVSAQAIAASVWTNADDRDEHLRSSDFLDVEQHELITFESAAIEVVEGNHWNVRGDLTVRGHSRPVTLDTRYFGIVRDADDETRAGFVAETDIQRSDWGLRWNAEQISGTLVSDRVRITLYISARPIEDDAETESDTESTNDDELAEWSPDRFDDDQMPTN
jgi:polyisoprenoid-binding protein YceI